MTMDADGTVSYWCDELVNFFCRYSYCPDLYEKVAVVTKIKTKFYLKDESLEDASVRLAKSLPDQWGVGDKERQNGFLVFVSIADRRIYISVGSGISRVLTDEALDGVIANMMPQMRQQAYGAAISQCVVELVLLLSGNTLVTYNAVCSDVMMRGVDYYFFLLFVAVSLFQTKLNTMLSLNTRWPYCHLLQCNITALNDIHYCSWYHSGCRRSRAYSQLIGRQRRGRDNLAACVIRSNFVNTKIMIFCITSIIFFCTSNTTKSSTS